MAPTANKLNAKASPSSPSKKPVQKKRPATASGRLGKSKSSPKKSTAGGRKSASHARPLAPSTPKKSASTARASTVTNRDTSLEPAIGSPNAKNQPTYDIEKIVAKRSQKGVTKYLVKWQNFPASDNTWEPLANLAHCEDYIEDFEDRKAAYRRQKSGSKKKRTSRNKKPISPEVSSNSATPPAPTSPKADSALLGNLNLRPLSQQTTISSIHSSPAKTQTPVSSTVRPVPFLGGAQVTTTPRLEEMKDRFRRVLGVFSKENGAQYAILSFENGRGSKFEEKFDVEEVVEALPKELARYLLTQINAD